MLNRKLYFLIEPYFTFKIKCLPGDEERIIVTDEFIEKNNLKLISPEEIDLLVDDDYDIFGFRKEVIIEHLPWELAKKYFKKDYVIDIEKGEKEFSHIDNIAEITQDFLDYMVFAWMKAMNERSISASRSIGKLATWMRILSRPDIADILENDDLYYPYGRPVLVKACEELGIDYPKYLNEIV